MKRLLVLCLSMILIVGCSSTQQKEEKKSTSKSEITDKVAKTNTDKKQKSEDTTDTKTEEKSKTNDSAETKTGNKKNEKDSTPNKNGASNGNTTTEQKPVEKPVVPQQPQQPTQPEKPVQPEEPAKPQYTESSYAEEVRSLINTIRVNNGLPALYSNSLLTSITQQRADHQLQSYGHRLPDGTHSGTWIESQGIIPGGEDVAMMSQSFLPQAVVDAWMESPGHRAPILADYNSYMDIAVRFANGKVYVVACWQQ